MEREQLNTFSTELGQPIMIVTSGKKQGELISITPSGSTRPGNLSSHFITGDGELALLIPNTSSVGRTVEYIAGPSGSGKSTIVAGMVKRYLKAYPKTKVYLFSRSQQEDDPAFKSIPFIQIEIDDGIVNEPIDITQIRPGSILVFDDIGTIHSDTQRRAVEKIVMDALEVGRKFRISVIVTSHLIIPQDKKFARVIMNEIQYITVFPKSGTTQQISYALTTYFGIGKNELDKILQSSSRWVTLHTRYPRFVMYDRGAYFL